MFRKALNARTICHLQITPYIFQIILFFQKNTTRSFLVGSIYNIIELEMYFIVRSYFYCQGTFSFSGDISTNFIFYPEICYICQQN